MDTNVKITTYGLGDNDCIQGHVGTTDAVSAKIDMATFTQSTMYPDGYLPKGTVLAKRTSDSLYCAYDDSLSDGTQTAVGILLAAIHVSLPGASTTNKVAGALMWHGKIKAASAPFSSGKGALDAAAKADLAAKFLFV